MRRIVVGVDGSEGSRHALRWAAAEARAHDAELEAVVSWQYPALTTMPAFGVLPPAEEMHDEARKGLQEVLDAEGLGAGSDLVARATVVQGPPGATLLEVAEGADLLVVGTRGRGGFTGLLLGSVSQQCVTHAPCPVVVVPPPR